jgi:hypothetical protein
LIFVGQVPCHGRARGGRAGLREHWVESWKTQG